jgi:hypothetical protein
MKQPVIKFKGIPIFISILLALPTNACEKDEGSDENNITIDEAYQESANDNLYQQINSFQKEELSQKEIDGLLFIREEEKLARDVYLTLNEIHPLRPFQNISKSEQQHMDAIKYLLDRYGLDDPAKENEIGSFSNTELQELYNTLIEKGKKSRVDALKVGALIEEKDIYDLDLELENAVDNQDIKFVYENLIRGSKNHLRAFTNVLYRNGVEYSPVILDPSYYNDIINRR